MHRKEFMIKSAGAMAAITVSQLLKAAEPSNDKKIHFVLYREETVKKVKYSYKYDFIIPENISKGKLKEVALEVNRSSDLDEDVTSKYVAKVKKYSEENSDHLLQCKCYETEDSEILEGTSLEVLTDRKFYLRVETGGLDNSLVVMNKKKRKVATVEQKDDACYLTTVCVEHLGKADDCEELSILRRFRDAYIRETLGQEELVQKYYQIAPQIVRRIKQSENKDEILDEMYQSLVQPTLKRISEGKLEEAKNYYTDYSLRLYNDIVMT